MVILSLRIYRMSLTLSLSFPWESVPWCVYISSLAWAGLTLLILIKGQCEGLTAGISVMTNRGVLASTFIVSLNEYSTKQKRQIYLFLIIIILLLT